MIGRPRATTHWAIRDAAIRLFIRDGYAETSLAAVAQECGISRTTLFAYFPAKADILLYGDERNIERVLALLADAPFDMPAGLVLLRAARTMRPLPSNARQELAVYWHILDANADVAAKARLIGRRYGTAITGFLAQRLGTAPDDSLPALLGETLPAALAAATRHWPAHPELGPSLEDALEQAVVPLVTGYLGSR